MSDNFNYVSQSNQTGYDYSGGFFHQVGDALANIGKGIENQFTGNWDYQRQLEMMGFQNQFNASEAQKEREWQERMSNTSYQRAVSDLKAAGLNPYLAYQQGGAYTGTGASARSGQGGSFHSGQGFSQLFSLLLGTMNNATKIANQAMYNQTLKDVAAIRSDSAFDVAHLRYNVRNGYRR